VFATRLDVERRMGVCVCFEMESASNAKSDARRVCVCVCVCVFACACACACACWCGCGHVLQEKDKQHAKERVARNQAKAANKFKHQSLLHGLTHTHSHTHTHTHTHGVQKGNDAKRFRL